MESLFAKPNNKDYTNQRLRAFFIEHLNLIYCAKSHLAERLPEIAEQTEFTDLRHAINETLEDVGNQLKRMDKIYDLLEARHSMDNCTDKITFMESAYNSIHQQSDDYGLRDMSILFYMQNIESMELASFHVLLMMATRFKDKKITQLLKENADEAKGDLALFVMVTAKYITH